jgi:hypothetical protein
MLIWGPAVFIITSWYKRSEVQQRPALFYAASAFSGAFSGLLAFAIAKLDSAHNIEGLFAARAFFKLGIAHL